MTRDRPSRAELMQGWAVEPPDMIYRSVSWLVVHGKRPWHDAPPELVRAWAYLRPGEGGLASLGQEQVTDPAIARSFAIARCSATCQLARGLVLADAPVGEIATYTDAPADAISLYERIFWSVRTWLSAPGHVYVAIESLGLVEQDTLNLRLAYGHGRDVFLQALGLGKLTPATAALLQELSANRTRLRALAAMQRPIESAQDAARAIRSYSQLRKLEMKETRERHKLEQVQRKVETVAVNLDKNARTQWTNLKAERRRLEQSAAQLARRERVLAEREAECARMMAEAQQVFRQNEKPPVATPALAALREDPGPEGRRARLNVV
ncbi:MAG TPA: hypothetical protein VM487_10025 [Phycisphaerae bacterium]|nr:hypothetical protein [Phycisphaerae bacterium]